MAFQRLLFSGVLHILLIRALAGSDLFDDVQQVPDITTLHQENPAGDESKSSTQDFYDETETAGGYDDDFSSSSDSLFSTASPDDVSILVTADDLDPSLSSLYDGSDPDLSLFENPDCSSYVNQSINKREKAEMCYPTDSSNPSTPDQSFERGGPSDPEFYGLSLAGYDVQLLGPDEEQNGCRRDTFDLAKFLVCDSGLNEDRFSFYTKSGVLIPGIALRNCHRSMSCTFTFSIFFRRKIPCTWVIRAQTFLSSFNCAIKNKADKNGKVTAVTRLLCQWPRFTWCCQFFFTKHGAVCPSHPPV